MTMLMTTNTRHNCGLESHITSIVVYLTCITRNKYEILQYEDIWRHRHHYGWGEPKGLMGPRSSRPINFEYEIV